MPITLAFWNWMIGQKKLDSAGKDIGIRNFRKKVSEGNIERYLSNPFPYIIALMPTPPFDPHRH